MFPPHKRKKERRVKNQNIIKKPLMFFFSIRDIPFRGAGGGGGGWAEGRSTRVYKSIICSGLQIYDFQWIYILQWTNCCPSRFLKHLVLISVTNWSYDFLLKCSVNLGSNPNCTAAKPLCVVGMFSCSSVTWWMWTDTSAGTMTSQSESGWVKRFTTTWRTTICSSTNQSSCRSTEPAPSPDSTR